MTIYYSCRSVTGVSFQGKMVNQPPITSEIDLDGVISLILQRVAGYAKDQNLPWNPFDLDLAVRAQPVPKPKVEWVECMEEFKAWMETKFEEDEEDGFNT